MSGPGRRLLGAWLGVLLLVGAQVALALLLPGRAAPAVVLAGAAAGVTVVVLAFMRLRDGPPLAHAFVVAALLWLVLLLGLGGMDPLTRIDYPVPVTRFP